jgi:uncharacterized membrane protein
MARRILIALLATLAGYLVGAVGGGWLVSLLSSNTHDVSVEAAMTGAFVTGPLAALVAFIAGFILAKRPQHGNVQ